MARQGMEMTDDPIESALVRNGYHPIRKLPTGDWAGVLDMMFTYGLMVGCDTSGFRTRFCYEHRADASKALMDWNGEGDPPGLWIKEKGRGGDRLNPAWALKEGPDDAG